MDRHDEMLKVELLCLSCRVLGQTCRTPSEFQPVGVKVVAVEEEGAFDLYHKKKHTSSFCLDCHVFSFV